MKQRFALERRLQKKFSAVVGVDEVGRGPLAGPVVAAAVMFNNPVRELWWSEIADSKTLPEKKRQELATKIKENAVWGIGIVSPAQIDRINIHQATLLAMRKAVSVALRKTVQQKSARTSVILVDGKFIIPKLEFEQMAIVKGDDLVHSIAAASIVAKVYRDALMEKLDAKFPEYGLVKHKGYGTAAHIAAIKTHGLTAIHRATFCGNIV